MWSRLPLVLLAGCTELEPREVTTDEAVADADAVEALRSVLALGASSLVAGELATLTVTGASPGETVYFAWAAGSGGGPCPVQLGGVCLDLDPGSAALLGGVAANGAGVATLNARVPAGAAGIEAALQAVVARGAGGSLSLKSDAVLRTVAVGVGDLRPGDLVVNEIMNNPLAVDDAWAEWFEVLNTTGDPVELEGLEVSDLGVDGFTVTSSVLVAPGGFVVFGREGDPALNGGVAVDFVWSNLALANSVDELVLSHGATVFDEVVWDDGGAFPDPSGSSISLDPAAATAGANDAGEVWCTATTPFGAGDDGTPGAANPSCGGVVPSDVDGDGYLAPQDCDDTHPGVHPGAQEVCDGEDNDCSGAAGAGEVDANGDGLLDCAANDCSQAGYAGAAGLAGDALKTSLQGLTSAQTCGSYDAAREFMFVTLDKVGGTVECVYTGELVAVGSTPPDPNYMNTEHTFPQSWGADTVPQKCDLHHLFPTRSYVNSARGNLPFGEVVSVVSTYAGGSVLGDDASGTRVFEPRDTHKGNSARAMLYMATRYGYALSAPEVTLYQSWHALDPVDADELDRTWDIAAEQVLTNPYVVCPQYVDAL